MSRNYVKDGHKTCPRCETNKPVDAFGLRSSGAVHSWCTTCRRSASKEWSRKRTPAYDRNANLKSKFGITSDMFDGMKLKQLGVCAICHLPNGDKHLVVDHCHATGEIRQLLCSACNTGLGMFKDNPDFLIEAAKYVQRHKEVHSVAGVAINKES